MRIENNGVNAHRIQGPQTPNQVNDAAAAGGPKRPNGSDTVNLSASAQDIRTARKALAGLPDVREDRIAELKQRIAAGGYNPSAEEIVRKMIGG